MASRLDYANVVLFNMSDKNLSKLQRVQNTLARVVSSSSRYHHASSLLADLHWLLIKTRINFKLATITFNCRANLAPPYLTSLLSGHIVRHTLRSSSDTAILELPRTKSEFGAPALYEQLESLIKYLLVIKS